jgi:nucleoside-triphosphatase THEP1
MKIYITNENNEVLNKAIEQDMSVLLVGESGTGKTSAISEKAKEHNRELYRINLTGQTGVDDIIGRYGVNEKGTFWIDGLITRAMREGKWVVLDEINMALPDILSKLHSLLDHEKKLILNEKDGEVVTPHKDFRVFATMNPSDDYAGTKELNMAFMSRFGAILWFDYANKEADILVEQGGIDIETANLLTLLAKEARKNKQDGKLSYMVNTRDLVYCSQLIKGGINRSIAVESAIINKYPQTEKGAIGKLFSLISDNKIKVGDKNTGESFTSIENMVEKYEKTSQELKDSKKTIEKLEQTSIEKADKINILEDRVIEVLADDRIKSVTTIKKKLEDVLVKS